MSPESNVKWIMRFLKVHVFITQNERKEGKGPTNGPKMNKTDKNKRDITDKLIGWNETSRDGEGGKMR